MWPRIVETMIGMWLAMSPFIFGHPADATMRWVTDLGAAAAVVVLALASYWHRMKRAHLAILIIAAWLVGFGFTQPYPTPPALQNDLVVGLLLLMFAIIPNETTQPPQAWRAYLEKKVES